MPSSSTLVNMTSEDSKFLIKFEILSSIIGEPFSKYESTVSTTALALDVLPDIFLLINLLMTSISSVSSPSSLTSRTLTDFSMFHLPSDVFNISTFG